METKQSEQFNTQSNVGDTHSSKLVTNDPIKNTPFRLIGNTTQGYAIAMGNYRLTEPKETTEEALEELEFNQWNIFANMVVIIIQTYKKVQEENK